MVDVEVDASRKAGKAWWRECAALLHVASIGFVHGGWSTELEEY
jgi:hypothetical protein